MSIFQKMFGPPNVDQLFVARDMDGLIKALEYKKDSRIRKSAALALGKIGDTRSSRPLISALRDEDEIVRQAAVEALGNNRDLGAIPFLIARLNDTSQNVISAAKSSLVKIGPIAVDFLLAILGPEQNMLVRVGSIEVLGEIGDTRAVEALIDSLKDANQFVRWAAAVALGKIGDPRAVESLIGTLRDDILMVQDGATQALVKIGAQAMEALTEAIEDGDEQVQKAAAEVLKKIKDQLGMEKERTKDGKTRKQAGVVADEDPIKHELKSVLPGLPVIQKEVISKARQQIINFTSPPHPLMFSGTLEDTADYAAKMVQQTENFIRSCKGITDVKHAFLITSMPVRQVLEIQYEQFWDDGSSSIYNENVARFGEDQFEVFGSQKSAARMAAVWKK